MLKDILESNFMFLMFDIESKGVVNFLLFMESVDLKIKIFANIQYNNKAYIL